ncbi:cytochrome P450 [Artomyces pyxidatus]|uniref:Cytochrome P450 n=1 Tax=Artomyces pyxidatus TaxID=48021 RepID=A0ACB8T3L6_9AGAM|nr:cytochrome P450 [Artomyces pyxidatus]
MNPATLLLTALPALAAFYWYYTGQRLTAQYPPGPRPDPIIGNLRHMQFKWMYKLFAEWTKVCKSDVIHVSLFGRSIIFLNSYKACSDLLDKRSTIYSDRPRVPMVGELMGFSWVTLFTNYGPEHRKNRQLTHHALSTTAIRTYVPMIQHWIMQFLHDSLVDPQADMAPRVRELSSVITMELCYGHDVASRESGRFTALAEEGVFRFQIGVSGGYLVDFIPALKYLPAWLPGTRFLQVAKDAQPVASDMLDMPFDAVKESMAAGTSDVSFTHTLLAEKGAITGDSDEEELIKRNAATLFGAGADTPISTLMSFILAMTLYPEVQRKAQEEIERVVGTDRLPDMSDRPNLPYIEAIVKETLRWNPAAPMGSPHRLREDDVYNGYLIPKDATIFTNVWAIMHDEEEYYQSFDFIPERFLVENPPRDPWLSAFGFGRRICPGIAFVSVLEYLFIAQTLAVFKIEKAVDADGKPKEPHVVYTPGVISHPSAFECKMAPRSERAAKLVNVGDFLP